MRTKTHEQFVEQMRSISPNIEILGTYKSAETELEVRCTLCGEVWSAKPSALLMGRRKCASCRAKGIGIKRRKTTEQFKAELAEISPHIEVLGEYVACKKKILVRCNRCQNQWEVVPASLRDGHDCPVCAKRRVKIYNKIRHMEQGD